jgi:hypothetical protein
LFVIWGRSPGGKGDCRTPSVGTAEAPNVPAADGYVVGAPPGAGDTAGAAAPEPLAVG